MKARFHMLSYTTYASQKYETIKKIINYSRIYDVLLTVSS